MEEKAFVRALLERVPPPPPLSQEGKEGKPNWRAILVRDRGKPQGDFSAGANVRLILEVPAALGASLEPWRKALEADLRTREPGAIVVLTAERARQDDNAGETIRKGSPAPRGPKRTRPSARERHAADPPLVPHVRHIVAVASGKGGVGKSTVTANLALALARLGWRVGLLDADIYGPSQALMLGLSGKPAVREGRIQPHRVGEVAVTSMGLLVPDGSAAIWRGPMVQHALVQLLNDVEWGTLDCLLLDMPPGTGDIPLTLAQRLPRALAVVVSTPQEVALLDVRKAAAMFRRLDLPIVGVVENMSGWRCPHCGEISEPFGGGGAARWAESEGLSLLARVPLDPLVRESGDAGAPVVMAEPRGASAAPFLEAAHGLRAILRARDERP